LHILLSIADYSRFATQFILSSYDYAIALLLVVDGRESASLYPTLTRFFEAPVFRKNYVCTDPFHWLLHRPSRFRTITNVTRSGLGNDRRALPCPTRLTMSYPPYHVLPAFRILPLHPIAVAHGSAALDALRYSTLRTKPTGWSGRVGLSMNSIKIASPGETSLQA
jgi:hypothetical protein